MGELREQEKGEQGQRQSTCYLEESVRRLGEDLSRPESSLRGWGWGRFARAKDSIAWEKMVGEFLPDSTENFAELRG